ncbi:MAG TPA: hypothetical protein VM717_03745 [Chthoniobacterales bacterium]|nr:hypothetical protein [Chthoniobacterales bacterium]
MKFQNMVVDMMLVKKGEKTVARHGDPPLSVELLMHAGGNPLQEFVRRRAVKSEINLARGGVDSELLYLWVMRKDPFDLWADTEQGL